MNTINPRRRQILTFIRSRVAAEGQSPSLDEIATACGLKSRSAAQKHVKALEARGDLEVTPGKARSARPKQRKPAPLGATPLFEISLKDVGDLTDSDLRELVARLCMAGLAEVELPTTLVIWGGDQRAADGGIDIRVQFPVGAASTARFPRMVTGFQVKDTRMCAGDIRREMCPNGLIRHSIQDIIRSKGSYIIATSDSAADEEYKKRLAAMHAAVAAETGHEQANFDYYDARRLADWTNQHPSVVAWVRSRLGRALQGWQPYGQWAETRGSNPQSFLPDEKHRLTDPYDAEQKFSLVDGLVHVRKLLRTFGSSVRLTGLSGVGKTRFAQALFESYAAPDPLPADLAVYTDMSNSPNPTPVALLDELLASGRRAILVIDNCSSQLHNQITARCKASSRVSVLTIEYDIREDQLEETTVFRLESGSTELIEQVIRQQFPHISQVNIATITKFADGNSRVAIALASTANRNESLAGLKDRELFERLFWVGKEVQQELLVAAQACALVYSFDVEDLDGELAQLATLVDETPIKLYRHVADLAHRGLTQCRGVWRAVLPHAVANTLAVTALDKIPESLITRCLVDGQDRLLRSFSRRLGYLHDSPKAVAIVRKWLSAGEMLGNLADYTPLFVEVLINVAPVDPAATIEVIERALQGPDAAKLTGLHNSARARFVRLVRSIAYESRHFDRCMTVLLAFALAEAPEDRMNDTQRVIASLFSLYLSGTLATTEQRMNWVRTALMSSNPMTASIGQQCLSAALECHQFSSHYGFEFGARIRDYGWSPKGLEAQAWFESFINLSVEAGRGDSRVATAVQDLLARHFRYLWVVAKMADALEAAATSLQEVGWEKGWLAIRKTIQFDGKNLTRENNAKLRNLEERLKPKTLVGRVKAIVLNGNLPEIDFENGGGASHSLERAGQLARELGELVACDANAFSLIAPLVVCNEQGLQAMFGAGLADGADSIVTCWGVLVSAFESKPEEHRNVQVLRGFLRGVFERDPIAFEDLLDNAMNRVSLAKWIAVLQLSAPLDPNGCERMLTSMNNPSVPAWVFQYLGLGRTTQNLPDDTLAQLLQRLSIKPDGLEIAIDVLSMHIFDNPNPIGPRVKELARSLLVSIPLNRNNLRMDHALSCLVEFFLKENEGEAAAREVLTAVRKGFEDYSLSSYDLTETLAALFKVQSKAALDILVGDDTNEGRAYFRRRELAGDNRSSALAGVPIEALVKWCEAGAPERWPHVAALIPAIESRTDGENLQWSKDVLTLLQRAPQPVIVAESLVEVIEPMSWSGSRVEAIRRRLPLLEELANLLGAEHAEQVAVWRNQITKTMDREARREMEEHRARDQRFE